MDETELHEAAESHSVSEYLLHEEVSFDGEHGVGTIVLRAVFRLLIVGRQVAGL